MITQQELMELVRYDSASGLFYLQPRLAVDGRVALWNERYTGRVAGSVGRRGYRNISIGDRLYKAHRLAWFYVHGNWPDGQIDHINGDRDDNRIANLRVVSQTDNSRNSGIARHNTSGVIGVSAYNYRKTPMWVARIRVNDRLLHLGYFDSIDDAAAARRAAEVEYGFHPNHGSRRSRSPMRKAVKAQREGRK